MVNGDSTKRSQLNDKQLVKRMQDRAVELLRDETEVWAIVDGSELRKPYAQEMESLMKVRALGGTGLVTGYRTINVIGVAAGKRGLLYHHLFSSRAEDFASESRESQQALSSVAAALKGSPATVTYLLDRGFDDIAIWSAIWGQENHLVCRLGHLDRSVKRQDEAGHWQACSLSEAAEQLVVRAKAEAKLKVRKRGQRRAKRQQVQVEIASCAVRVNCWSGRQRSGSTSFLGEKTAWLVRVQIEETNQEPWWLLTDWTTEDSTTAIRIFQMYCQRWAVEDGFKFIKQCVGWEEVQMLDLAAIRLLVALGWVAAGFLYELGVTWEWVEIELLAKLGGWEKRQNRPPGKVIIAQGLRRLLDVMAVEAVLNDHITTHGHLPPRIAALLGRN